VTVGGDELFVGQAGGSGIHEGMVAMSTFNVRIATRADEGASDQVLRELGSALFAPAAPIAELQEIDGEEVVVQCRIALEDAELTHPTDVRHLIAEAGPAFELLSVSRHSTERSVPRSAWPEALFTPEAIDLPSAAKRAVQDGVPTAEWSPRHDGRIREGGAGCWTFAVPVATISGGELVAVTTRVRRIRFSSSDSTKLALAVHESIPIYQPSWCSTDVRVAA
jgi:hypothetical protein